MLMQVQKTCGKRIKKEMSSFFPKRHNDPEFIVYGFCTFFGVVASGGGGGTVINQPSNQSFNQPIRRSVDQSIVESTNYSIN